MFLISRFEGYTQPKNGSCASFGCCIGCSWFQDLKDIHNIAVLLTTMDMLYRMFLISRFEGYTQCPVRAFSVFICCIGCSWFQDLKDIHNNICFARGTYQLYRMFLISRFEGYTQLFVRKECVNDGCIGCSWFQDLKDIHNKPEESTLSLVSCIGCSWFQDLKDIHNT